MLETPPFQEQQSSKLSQEELNESAQIFFY